LAAHVGEAPAAGKSVFHSVCTDSLLLILGFPSYAGTRVGEGMPRPLPSCAARPHRSSLCPTGVTLQATCLHRSVAGPYSTTLTRPHWREGPGFREESPILRSPLPRSCLHTPLGPGRVVGLGWPQGSSWALEAVPASGLVSGNLPRGSPLTGAGGIGLPCAVRPSCCSWMPQGRFCPCAGHVCCERPEELARGRTSRSVCTPSVHTGAAYPLGVPTPLAGAWPPPGARTPPAVGVT